MHPNPGSNLQPGHVPRPGVQPTTFRCTGCSNQPGLGCLSRSPSPPASQTLVLPTRRQRRHKPEFRFIVFGSALLRASSCGFPTSVSFRGVDSGPHTSSKGPGTQPVRQGGLLRPGAGGPAALSLCAAAQNASSASGALQSCSCRSRRTAAGRARSPSRRLSRVRTFTVLLLCSFGPTTNWKL